MTTQPVAALVGRLRLLSLLSFLFLLCAASAHADFTDSRMANAVTWLNAHQNANGSWGAIGELTPRDTARVLHAFALTGAPTNGNFTNMARDAQTAQNRAYAWFTAVPVTANQLLAEEALALAAGRLDASVAFTQLLQQHSGTGLDFGGFAEHNGDTYDSALAIEALATNEALYTNNISSIVTSIVIRQNVDGGWGIDSGFSSNPLLTAEVLLALGSTQRQLASPGTIAAAQAYLVRTLQANGSFGGDILTTAIAWRALMMTRYPIAALPAWPYTYLRNQQAADGSWSGDAYVTARVLVALNSDRPNVTINPGDFTLSPATVAEGGRITATVKLTNSGTQTAGGEWLAIYTAEDRTTPVATFAPDWINPGATYTATFSFNATNLLGSRTFVAVADYLKQLDEIREDDNEATATITVSGKPDLQVFASDITTTPSHLVPGQAGQLLVSIHNGGQSDAGASAYSVYQKTGSVETLLLNGSLPVIPAGNAQTLSIPVTLAAGDYTFRVVVDTANAVDESSETNNQATRDIAVTNASNVDFRMQSVVVTPSQPAAGSTASIVATLDNVGTESSSVTVTFYDGVPGAGGAVIASQTQLIGPQATLTLQTSYTVTASSAVIYAVADPANTVPEIDETNNAAFAALTNQYTDLEVVREGIILPKTLPRGGQSVSAKFVVKNKGLVAATHAEVVVYDDLPQRGGVVIADTFVDVPASANVVVPATWTLRSGQRVATVVVNPTRTVAEVNYANDRATRAYVVNGSGQDIYYFSDLGTDLSQLVVDALTLKASGTVTIGIDARVGAPSIATIFEDVDGDRAFNPEVDNVLGATLVPANTRASIVIAVQGTVRFAPGHLMVYFDSGNANDESDETNNIVDLYHSCQDNNASFKPRTAKWRSETPSHNLSPVARLIDTNGDGVIDGDDAAFVVIASNGGILARRGDTGALLWQTPSLNSSGRQISPVIADLDGDGKPEIISHTDIDPVTGATMQHRLVALNADDGSRKWTSPPLDRDPLWETAPPTLYSYGGAPAVADLDGDGHPEVITGRTALRGSDGTIEWVGAGGAGRVWTNDAALFPDQEAPIAVDVDGDGRLDVVAGNTVYRADGTILWQRTDLPDGYTAPVYFGSETTPHICLVAQGKVWMLTSTGTTTWGPVTIPNGALLGGAPAVYYAGQPYVAVAGDGYLTSFYATTGQVYWSQRVATDVTSTQSRGTNSATVFNILNEPFLFYVSVDRFSILRGQYGDVQYSDSSFGANPYYPGGPAVADVDGDGHADVVLPGRDAVRVLSDGSWYSAPSVFNEASTHGVNVADEKATIPAHETPDAFSRQNFRAQRSAFSSAAALLPNLSASYPRTDNRQYPASTTLIVRIGNNGWAGADATKVDFHRVNADNSSTLLGTSQAGVIQAGGYQDVGLTISNPPAALVFYAVVNANNAVTECDSSDNRSVNFTVHLGSDITAAAGSLAVSDALPRPGDVIDLAASAYVTGPLAASSVTAQFFLGNPASGGTAISPVLPVTVTRAGSPSSIVVSYQWTVSAPTGPQSIYVKFDPQNAIVEDDETNNTLSTSINVSTSDPIEKLSGTVTLTPPAAEAGTSVGIDVLLQNLGNVPLANVQLTYNVTGGPATGATGSVTVASIAKNALASVHLGAFVPTGNATYSVTIAASDPAIALLASPQTITIGPFAAGLLTVTPSQVPTSFPLIQAHAHVARANTISIAEDPLVPLIRAHVQRAIDFESNLLLHPTDGQMCFKCHVQAQGLVSLQTARGFSGVNVNPVVESTALQIILGALDPVTGVTPSDSESRLAAWALARDTNGSDVTAHLPALANYVVASQKSDGSWRCEEGTCNTYFYVSYVSTEAQTAAAVEVLARAYDQTKNPALLDSMIRAERWLLAYNYAGTNATNCEYAARVSMGLSRLLPYLDTSQAAVVRKRVADIASFLRALQNADGSFGDPTDTNVSSSRPVTRTAQSLIALTLDGATPGDSAVRNATVWLLNHQGVGGNWPRTNTTMTAIDQTTWAVIALGQVWGKTTSFDVDFHLAIPATTDFVATIPSDGQSSASAGTGQELTWHLPNVSNAGADIYANLRLNGLANGESRPIATDAWLTYNDPYSGKSVRQSVAVPSVTGVANAGLALSTDRSSYSHDDNVVITESITNAAAGMTTDVVVKDAGGTTVATVAAADPLAGVPAVAFPGWHYALPVSIPVASGGVNRHAALSIDFAAKLAQLGVTGTFDVNSVRVSDDRAPSAETYFLWTPTASATSGIVQITIPDDVPAGSTYALHVYFDTVENGFKPVSLYSHAAPGTALQGDYYAIDTTRQSSDVANESQLVFLTPAVVSRFEANTDLGNNFPFAAGLPQDQFVARWTGSLFIPATGSYTFDLASDDGSWLFIDGVQVINNGGAHGTRDVVQTVTLTAGFHAIRVSMYEWGGGQWLSLKWAQAGQSLAAIPAQYLLPSLPITTGITYGTPQSSGGAATTRTYTWNTGATASGTYVIDATLRQSGALLVERTTSIAINPASQFTASVATDHAAYDPNQTVHVTAAAQFAAGNVPLTNLSAIVSIANSGGTIVATRTTPIASLQPGQTANASLDWSVGSAAPGTYSASLVVKDAGGSAIAQKSVPFTVRSTAQNGFGISGTLNTPATIGRTLPLPLGISIHNGGNVDIANAPFAVRFAESATQAAAGEVAFTASAAVGATSTKSLSFDTSSLSETTYDAYLVSLISGTPVTLSKTTFTVTSTPTVITASAATDKASYDVGDTVHVTATVNLLTAPAPLTNVSVVTTVNGTSTTRTIASLAPGSSSTVNVDWPVGTTAPGTYSVTVAVNGTTQATTTFTITSTAVSGKGISGTLTAAGPVTQGQTIPLTATISDNGNVALSGASFSVRVGSDSLPFTIDVPLAGSASKTLSYLTSTPGTYTATLTSALTGDLASTTFTVNAIPTVITASVATDKASYDVGEIVHATTTVNLVSAPAPLTNVSVVTTINGVSTTRTIATLATSATVTVDWPAGTNAPGTYSVTSVVNGSVQATTTFTIISTAANGKGISGTLTAGGPVTQGQTIPLTATISDNGNVALSGASFSVRVGSDSLPFTIDVPLAGSASKTLSYLTSTPGIYTATLTSALTGDLATTTFTVNAIPTVITASVATDKASYDVGEIVHATTTVNLVSAPTPLTNVQVITTINGVSTTRTIATLATSATVTVDWPAGTNAPGTYSVTSVVNGSVQATTTFTIISTAANGKGISGTLTAPSSVTRGELLPLAATIVDSGNAQLVDAPFAINIGSDTLSFVASVPLGGSTTSSQTYNTASLVPGTYTATLVSLVTGQPVRLAVKSFTVTASATQPTMTLIAGSTGRVLLFAPCKSNGSKCAPATPAFLTTTLTNAGIGWTLVSDETAFLTALRSGGYTEVIFDIPASAERAFDLELSEAVHAGLGLIVLDDHGDAMPKLADALGMAWRGKLNATSTLLDVLSTPLSNSGQLTMLGDGVKVTMTTAKPFAKLDATQEPSFSYNVWGLGRTVVIPFDVEKTASSDLAKLLVRAVQYVSRPSGSDARSLVPVDVAVTAPTGGSITVTVALTLAQGLTVVDALPHFTGTRSWTATIAGGTTQHFIAWLRLGDATGNYDVTAALSMAGQPLSTKTLTLNVLADRAAIENALSADLDALAALSTDKRITDARNELAAERNTASTAVSAAIQHVLNITSDLQSLSIDTTAARRDADRLLSWWQSGLTQ